MKRLVVFALVLALIAGYMIFFVEGPYRAKVNSRIKAFEEQVVKLQNEVTTYRNACQDWEALEKQSRDRVNELEEAIRTHRMLVEEALTSTDFARVDSDLYSVLGDK